MLMRDRRQRDVLLDRSLAEFLQVRNGCDQKCGAALFACIGTKRFDVEGQSALDMSERERPFSPFKAPDPLAPGSPAQCHRLQRERDRPRSSPQELGVS